MKDKILFVCQRYGLEINGGAEMECRAYAEHLTDEYQVEVLTTCAVDYVTWDNVYPPGNSELNGVQVHRFPSLKSRVAERFAKVAGKVYQPIHTVKQEEEWIDEQGPFCPAAIDFLQEHSGEYKAVLFMTYLYYLTARGLVPEMSNSILIPTAHDEPPVHLQFYKRVFQAPKGIIYNTEEEKEFVEKLFPVTRQKPSCMVGYGIDPKMTMTPGIREKYGLGSTEYLLYSGRIDESKGCGVLFNYFQEYLRRCDRDLKLVLTGKAVMEVPKSPAILPLGFVSDHDKNALMRDARIFVLASQFESLSIVVLESLMMGVPVLVNGNCAVLRGHCEKSNAGLYFTNYAEFEHGLNYLLDHEDVYRGMSENGRRYVKENYNWDVITRRIRELIEKI